MLVNSLQSQMKGLLANTSLLMLREWPYMASSRDALRNTSPRTMRFPSGGDFAVCNHWSFIIFIDISSCVYCTSMLDPLVKLGQHITLICTMHMMKMVIAGDGDDKGQAHSILAPSPLLPSPSLLANMLHREWVEWAPTWH